MRDSSTLPLPPRGRHALSVLALGLALMLGSLPAPAQTPVAPGAGGSAESAPQQVEKTPAEALRGTFGPGNGTEVAEPAASPRVAEVYQQIEAAERSIALAREKSRALRAALDVSPQDQASQAESTAPAPAPTKVADLKLDPNASLDEVERLLTRYQSGAATLSSDLVAVERRLALQRDRPKQARAELEEKRRQTRELETDTVAPAAAGEDPALASAQQRLRETRMEATAAEVELLEQELLSHDVRYQALISEQERVKRALAVEQARVDLLGNLLLERRRDEANLTTERVERSRIEASGKHPAVISLAERNSELTQRLNQLVLDEGRIANAAREVVRRAETLEQDLQRYQQRLEIAGLNRVLGKLFVDCRRRLASSEWQTGAFDTGLESDLVDAGLGQLQAAEERAQLVDLDEAVFEILETEVAVTVSPEDRETVATELEKLLQDRIALLKKLEAAYVTRNRSLTEYEFGLRQLERVAQRFRTFLDEKLLWIPNLNPIDQTSVSIIGRAVAVLAEPATWGPVVEALQLDSSQGPLLYGLALATFALLLWTRRPMRRSMAEINARVGNLHTDRFRNTLTCTFIVFVLALPWPGLLLFLSWRLGELSYTGAFTESISQLCLDLGAGLVPLLIMQRLCERNGLAEIHFRWSRRATQVVRRQLALFTVVVVPTICLGGRGPWLDEDFRTSMSRTGLLIVALMLGYTVYRIVHPRSGAVADKLRVNPASLLARTRWLWSTPIIAAPFALALLAAFGYQFTAQKLTQDFYISLWVIALAYLVHEYGVRWLELTSARVAWREAQVERAAGAEATEATEASEGTEGSGPTEEPVVINFKSVNEQSLRLFSTVIGVGLVLYLWSIWSGLLPALGILDEIRLWAYDDQVGGETVLRHFTLANLVFALSLTFLFAVATPSLPRLIELVVLQRIAFTAGTLNAITTITRYVIIAVGVVVVFNTLGVGWSKVQWLVAAISVGLGFGLQEIFANFVSGLIILFERPVRIGDTVTVADRSGTVTRIRIRATTIRDWDNKEIVVPNKTLITTELTNWSLSDATLRVVLNVGIAYGSDTERAHQIMLAVATEHPRVLTNPPPAVFFIGMGNSSLDFEVRLFVGHITHLFTTKHDYFMALEKRLREAGISIPFPQRDIHIRSGFHPAPLPPAPAPTPPASSE